MRVNKRRRRNIIVIIIAPINRNFTDNFQTAVGVGQQMSFSSYPATLASIDDFYIMGPSALVMLVRHNLDSCLSSCLAGCMCY